MKKFFLPLLIGILSILAVYSFMASREEDNPEALAEESAPSVEIVETQEDTNSGFADNLEPIHTPPNSLVLPYREEGIPLVALGVDESGKLEVPLNPSEGGWYHKSANAGEAGNVLINAHYDDIWGRPAAFYNLKSVEVGDKVALVDSQGRHFYYRVTSTYYISIYDEDRVEKILESEGASLTLITCGGVWLPGEGTYNQRLVVKAVLESDS